VGHHDTGAAGGQGTAGYATVSFASTGFSGAFTNLHQGFEELHEVESTVGRAGPVGGTSKTTREYVDRLNDWLDHHRDVPAFVYLHFMDPHSPRAGGGS